SAYTGLYQALPLKPGSEACADETVFDPDSQIARFGASAVQGKPAPPLEISARGYTEGEFRNGYRSTFRLAGGWQGTRALNIPLTPPRAPVFGFLCVRNLGDVPVELAGSLDGRA